MIFFLIKIWRVPSLTASLSPLMILHMECLTMALPSPNLLNTACILPKSDGSGHYFQPLTPSCSQGSNSNSSTTDYDLITFEDTSVPPKRALLDGPKSQYLPAPTLDHSTACPKLDLLSIHSMIHDTDDGFQRPKHFKKRSSSGFCSFFSSAAYQHQSSSSLSSRSSHSQSAMHSNRYAALAPDFWEAKSD